MKDIPEKPKSTVAAVIAVQLVCVFLIIAGVLLVKRFSPAKAKKITAFFKNSMCEQTSADELLKYFNDKI